jgi:hypothetical protein
LPLVLWNTPPALELVLAQEGIAFQNVRDPHPFSFGVGRFVLYDSRAAGGVALGALLSSQHVPIDIDTIRRTEAVDPFEALLDTRADSMHWQLGDLTITERVARVARARLRRRVIDSLRAIVLRHGGIWARLSPYPFPHRSAFNLRADLDEPVPDDYFRFARARRPISECTTHFVSTHAYGQLGEVLHDLLGLDTQSHGHYHVVYASERENARNLERAHTMLEQAGFAPVGFAGPCGRWNAGLNAALEALGYLYSSEFQVGYDDWPFFPWLGNRFSRVLQVPVHPICDGLFLDAGARSGKPIAEHLVTAVRARIAAGEPAFVYGHPERRLGRFPEVVSALAAEVAGRSFVWKTTLTEFADWWLWRNRQRWSVVTRGEGKFELFFDEWDPRYRLGVEIVRGSHSAIVPATGPRMPLVLEQLAYERRPARVDMPLPNAVRRPHSLRSIIKSAIDWETVTPIEELSTGSIPALVKKELRHWRARKRQKARERAK